MVDRINFASSLIRTERGVTGLETAIILIAFVVVASVFAFTVLSTGIFSAERGKEASHAGLKGARSSLHLKGSVIAHGIREQILSVADSPWTGSTNVTTTADTADKKEGTASADMNIGVDFTTGLVAYDNLQAAANLLGIDTVQLWAKYGTTTESGDIELILDDSAGCGSPLENIDLPALAADRWQLVTVAISDNSDMTAIKCVGINLVTDAANQTLNIDKVVAQGQATSVRVTITNALEGEPIDMSEPSDSNANGLADPDSSHSLVLTYTDKNQVVRDIYWTSTFIGANDGDDLMESGEKVELNVTLAGLSSAYPLVSDTRWDLEIRPEHGTSVVVERKMPDLIDLVMNLK